VFQFFLLLALLDVPATAVEAQLSRTTPSNRGQVRLYTHCQCWQAHKQTLMQHAQAAVHSSKYSIHVPGTCMLYLLHVPGTCMLYLLLCTAAWACCRSMKLTALFDKPCRTAEQRYKVLA